MNHQNKRRGGSCCLFVVLESFFLILIVAGGLFFLRNTGFFSHIYKLGKGHITYIPGFERLASGDDETMINDEKELVDLVNKALKDGKKSFVFQTETLDDDFINNINSCTEAFYGSCSNYTTTKYGSFREIKMTCTLTNAYYVERYLLEDKEIPSDREDASKLAKKCEEILEKLDMDDLTEYRKEKKIHDYIVKHTKYTTEGDRDILSSPEGPLLHGQGVCSGYARAMKLLCDLVDVECKTVVGTGNEVDHEWNMVRIQDQWYHVDVTWDDPLPDQKYPMFAYLNLQDKDMALDHVWENDYYPSATSTVYDYYQLNEAFCDDYSDFRSYMEKELASHPDKVRVMVGDYDKDNYSEDNLKFLFNASGAKSYSYATCGPSRRTEIYFTFNY